SVDPDVTEYTVFYNKLFNTNVPEPTTNNAAVTTQEVVSTDPTNVTYVDAFNAAVTYDPKFLSGPAGADGGVSSGIRTIDDIGAFRTSTAGAVDLGPTEVVRIHMF